jgi:hypothetical protein
MTVLVQKKSSGLLKILLDLEFLKTTILKFIKKLYITDQYLLNMHCKFGVGTIYVLRAIKYFLVFFCA